MVGWRNAIFSLLPFRSQMSSKTRPTQTIWAEEKSVLLKDEGGEDAVAEGKPHQPTTLTSALMKPSGIMWGPPGHKSPFVSHFLFLGKRLSASWTFREFQRQIQTVTN